MFYSYDLLDGVSSSVLMAAPLSGSFTTRNLFGGSPRFHPEGNIPILASNLPAGPAVVVAGASTLPLMGVG